MTESNGQRWLVRGATFAVWALLAASAVFWLLQLTQKPAMPLPADGARTLPATDPQAIARILGGGNSPQPAQAPSGGARLELLGILAGSNGSSGAALIAVNDQPAKPFRHGQQVADGLVLQTLHAREVRLGASADSAPVLTLTMPDPVPAADHARASTPPRTPATMPPSAGAASAGEPRRIPVP